MFKSKWNIVVAFVACALLLPATVSAKKQVERPFNIRGDVISVVNLADGSLNATVKGNATHLGQFSGTSVGNAFLGYENAELTAANGDKLTWFATIIPGGPGEYLIEVTFTGGTGRFASATGGCSTVITPNIDASSKPGFWIITFSYSASGTITY